jgi:large subunit ribosomal protein L34e
MPTGKHKSRSLRRIFVRTPGSKTVVHYKQRKPAKAHCTGCYRVLAGVPQATTAVMRSLPKTQKRPERPYGGMYCTVCTRRILQVKARAGGVQ